jgi:hypothetical protein
LGLMNVWTLVFRLPLEISLLFKIIFWVSFFYLKISSTLYE